MGKLMKPLKKWTFKRKLFAYSVGLSLIPVLIIGMVSAYITSNSVQEEVNRNHQIILKQLEAQVGTFMQTLSNASIQIANNPFIQESLKVSYGMEHMETSIYMMDALDKAANNAGMNYGLSLYYVHFNEVYSSRYGMIRDMEYPFDQIMKTLSEGINGSRIIPPNTFEGVPELILTRNVPINSSNPDGYLAMHLDINKLEQLIEQLNLGGSRKVVIADEQGYILTSSETDEIGSRLTPETDLYRFWSNPKLFAGEVEWNGETHSVSSIQSSKNNWTYIALTPVAELSRKSDDIKQITWMLMLTLSVIWIIIAFLGSQRLYFPIQRLIGKFVPEAKIDSDGLKTIDTFMNRIVKTNQNLQSKLNEQEPLLLDGIIQQILRGEMTEKDIREISLNYNFPLKGSCFYVCSVDIDPLASFEQTYKEKDRFLIMYALRNMIEELCEPMPSFVAVTPKSGQMVMIFGLDKLTNDSANKVKKICTDIRKNVDTYFQFTVSIGISKPRPYYSRICESYQEALSLLDYRWVTGPNQIITTDDIETSLNYSSRVLIEWKTLIVNSIRKGEFNEARRYVKEMSKDAPRSFQNIETLLGWFVYVIGEIDLFLKELGLEINDLFEYDILNYLSQMTSLNEVQQWMSDTILTTVEEHLKIHNVSKQKRIISDVVEYIKAHYESDLSLQKLSDIYNVSPTMLSRMFKEETGESYLDYTIRFRMEKAKEWLVHTEMPIKEITDRLRYTSVPNFNRIFKKYTGEPPGNYRKIQRT